MCEISDDGDDFAERPKSEEELNASARARDAAKAFDTVDDIKDRLHTVRQMSSTLMIIAEGTPDGWRQDALFGIGKCIAAQAEEAERLREQAMHLLWGYGPGADRVAKEGGAP